MKITIDLNKLTKEGVGRLVSLYEAEHDATLEDSDLEMSEKIYTFLDEKTQGKADNYLV